MLASSYANVFYLPHSSLIGISECDFVEMCFVAGIFHDIGKCCARVSCGKGSIYTGHAQLGVRILEQLGNFSDKPELLWAINHHMCCCTHMNPIVHLDSVGEHLLMDIDEQTINPYLAFAILAVLSYADELGRISDDLSEGHINSQTVSDHSHLLFLKLCDCYRHRYDTHSTLSHGMFQSSKLIVIMYGLSGSGKSFTSNLLKGKFGEKCLVVHVERDQSLYTVYRNDVGDPMDKSYSDVYAAVSGNQSMKQRHQVQWTIDLIDALTMQSDNPQIIIIDSMQPLFLGGWAKTLESIQDSGPRGQEAHRWYTQSSKIGFYSIPMHCFGPKYTFESKIGFRMNLPSPDMKGMFFPEILTERYSSKNEGTDLRSAMDIMYGTGCTVLLCNYISNYMMYRDMQLSQLKNECYDDGKHQRLLHVILNEIVTNLEAGLPSRVDSHIADDEFEKNLFSIENIYNLFVELFDKSYVKVKDAFHETHGTDSSSHARREMKFISYRIEMSVANYQLVVFSYLDGFQQFNGITRDYRGEGLIYDTLKRRFLLIRPNLPVFPEMLQSYKDFSVQQYLSDRLCSVDSEHAMLYQHVRSVLPVKKIASLYMAPKYDGSMFNTTFVSCQHPHYSILKILLSSQEENVQSNTHAVEDGESSITSAVSSPVMLSFMENSYGVFLFGSKGRVCANGLVVERIYKAIISSYSSCEDFMTKCSLAIHSNAHFNSLEDIVTLHFEAIEATPTSELTVHYGFDWCPYLGMTIYNSVNETKEFHMPIHDFDASAYLRHNSVVYDCDASWERLTEIYHSNLQRLVDGSMEVEPEGYVIHVIGENGDKYLVKFKYAFYYAAHKPESKLNTSLIEALTTDDKYKTLCQRFAKLRTRLTFEEATGQIAEITLFMNAFHAHIGRLIELVGGSTSMRGVPKKDWAIYWKSTVSELSHLVNAVRVQLLTLNPLWYNLKETVSDKSIFGFVMRSYEKMHLDELGDDDVAYYLAACASKSDAKEVDNKRRDEFVDLMKTLYNMKLTKV